MRNCPICCKLSENLFDITNIKLSLVDGISLNDKLNVKLCDDCKFYYSDSNNTQDDYNNYYMSFNNYQQQSYSPDKDERCANFIRKMKKNEEIQTVIDYGSGNGVLANLLSETFIVDKFDIGMDVNNKKYDCLILSHVLEHIYDLNSFINEFSKNINDNGLLYIEVPIIHKS